MGYFDDMKNVKEYIKMAEGYDGKFLIEILKKHLKSGSTILELGMGPGKDFAILSRSFKVVGSDNSRIFINLFKMRNKKVDLLLLDARTIETERKFDCIYSNKVLHHLTKSELKESLQRQRNALNENGLLFHSFWKGNKEEMHHGLRFVYYTEDELIAIAGEGFEVIEIEVYSEMSKKDSLYLILKRNNLIP